MSSVPIIQITVEHMRETIAHAFNTQQMSLSAEVELALKRVCTPENIQRHVDEVTERVLKDSVEQAVRHWWYTSKVGSDLIREAVAAKMDEEAKWYREATK